MKRFLPICLLLPGLFALAAASAPRPAGAPAANSNLVTFQVDMSYRQAYLNAGDIVGLRAGTEPLSWFSTTPMSDPEADNIYTVTVDFSSIPPGTEVQYKFVHHDPGVTNILWEEPISTGGGNRSFNLAEGGQTVPVVKWDDVDQPFLIPRFDVYSTHSPQGYGFGAWVDVYDSLGLSHIAEVKMIAPLGSEHALTSEAPGNPKRFSQNILLGTSPPELGLYTIEATNLTPQTISVQENITNYIEQTPFGLYPVDNSLIGETTPVFDWQDVTDPESGISYRIEVVRRDNGQEIWAKGGLTDSEVVYNSDGTASENLQMGVRYRWFAIANDESGNSSSWGGNFAVGSGLVMIDGEKDAFWNTVTGQISVSPAQLVYGRVDSEEDGSARLYLAYDQNYLYGFFEAQDDIIGSQNNSDWWRNDGMSFKLDLNTATTIPVPSGSGSEPNAWDIVHLAFTAESGFPAAVNGTPNTLVARKVTVDGYAIEFAIPASEIRNEQVSPPETFILAEGGRVGFATEFLDKDFLTELFEAKMAWGHASASDYFFADVTQFGNLRLLANNQVEFSSENLVMPAEQPFIQVPGVRSRHWYSGDGGERWSLELWVHANDQQGLTDLDMVWVERPEGGQYQLYDDGNHNDNVPNDARFAFFPGGLNQAPAVGTYLFEARDRSGDLASISKNLDNVVEQIPLAVYPAHGSVIATTQPLFDWQDVNDPPFSITYSLNVHRHDNGQWIWGVGGLTTTAATFNFDGSARENLQEGKSYDWNVNAHDDFGNSSSWSGTFTVGSGDGPIITAFDLSTHHNRWGDYSINGWADVVDPQGLGDIQQVKVIDANGLEFTFNYEGSGNRYSGGRNYGSTPPPLGETRVIVIDQSANADTASENLSNLVEEIPTALYPSDNGLITETTPVFDWEEVTDPQSAITYSITVYRHDNGQRIWEVGGLSASSAQFNFNGTASENLQDGMGYYWDLYANDQFGNSSAWEGNFTISSGDGPVIVNFDMSTNHDQGGYRIDAWANVVDPQGQNDISTVKLIDAENNEYLLNYRGGNHYSGGAPSMPDPPPFGITRIVALDQAANSDTVSENLTNFVEELPAGIYPPEGGIISETVPAFDWQDVTDPQSSITYSVFVDRRDTGQNIWAAHNLSASEAVYNFNSAAAEALQDGMSYNLNINAHDQFGNNAWWGTYFIVSTGDGPIITAFDLSTHHNRWGDYSINGWADIVDPQGLGDIQQVKVIDANGFEFTLNYEGSGNRYSGGHNYGGTLPPPGATRIVVLDQSAHADTVSENLTNAVEQIPTAIYPADNGLITETTPVFDWEDVADPQSAITYSVNVHRRDNNQWIWGVGGLTTSSVQFNFNGAALENLQDGMGYNWNVNANDQFGNSSSWDGNFTVSSGDGPVIVNFDFWTFHGPWGYNLGAWADVVDPQGNADLQTVKAIDAAGNQFTLNYEGWGNRYSNSLGYGENPPPFGLSRIVAIDASAHSDTASENINNVIEQMPQAIHPPPNGYFSSDPPGTFQFTAVTDEQATITEYHLRVYHNGNEIWFRSLPGNSPNPVSVGFNDNGQATENLISGETYQWNVWALANDGNNSEAGYPYFTAVQEPFATNVQAQPAFLSPGESVTISATCWDADGLGSVVAVIESPDETVLQNLTLFDDGAHNDGAANDSVFANTWVTVGPPATYFVDLELLDTQAHSRSFNNAATFSTNMSVLPQQWTTDPADDIDASLTQLPDSRMFIVFSSIRSGQQEIFGQASTDMGASWSTPASLTPGSTNNRRPHAFSASNGTVWVLWERDGQIYYRTSNDNAANWSNEAQLLELNDFNLNPRMAQTSSGRLWVTFSNSGQGDAYDVFGVYSDDNGASWSSPQHLTNNPGNDHYANLAVNSTGTLFLIWDQSGGSLQADIYMKTSSDNGQTWSGQTLITNDAQRDAFPGFLIDASDRMHLVFGESDPPTWNLQYQYSDDAGASWSNRVAVTRFRGNDYVPKLARISGSPWMVFFSDRAGNYDVWAGIIDQMQDLDPPPFISFTGHTPGGPDPGDVITVLGDAFDETGIAGVELLYTVNGAPQANLALYDDGTHGDANAGDNRYSVQIGPYPAGTGIDYQVRAADIDGNTFTSPPFPRHFEVIDYFVKQQEVLLVADDQSNRYLHYYTAALSNHGYAHDVWERWVRGEIDSTVLQEYRNGIVVWYCGWSYPTLSSNERNALGPFLDAGGKLFITEQDIGYDLNVNQPAAAWYHDYLHASFVQDGVGLANLAGIAGDPIGDGLSFAIAGGDGANNQSWPSEIDPIAPAVAILRYTSGGAVQANPSHLDLLFEDELFATKPWSKQISNSQKSKSQPTIQSVISSGSGGLRIDDGGHKLVYLAFGFEGIADEANRFSLMGRVMNWLTGAPPVPEWLVPVSVNAVAGQANGQSESTSFNLAFGGHPEATDGYDLNLDIVTAPPGQNYYVYFSVAPPVRYLNTDFRGWVTPFEAPRTWSLQVVNATGTTSEMRWAPADLPPEGSFRLVASQHGIDLNMRRQSSVQFTGNATLLIQYRPTRCVTFDFNVPGGAWYLISLPVVPEDNSVERLFPNAVAAFGWDYTNQGYETALHLEPGKAYWLLMLESATVEICGELFETYTRNYVVPGWDLTGAVLEPSALVDNPDHSVLAMFGWNAVDAEYVSLFDFAVEPRQGYWILVYDAPSTVTAGGTGVAAAQAKPGTTAELAAFHAKYGKLPPVPPYELAGNKFAPIPESFGLSQNYPNPFNPETVIEYQLPQAGHVSLKIYDMMGREVRTLVQGEQSTGRHRVQWDGRDESGRKLNSGVYLYRIQAGSFSQTRKVVLLK